MKLTESRLRQIIREELTETTSASNKAILQPAPEDEDGRLELVIKSVHGQTPYTEFLDALDTRELEARYTTYTPLSVEFMEPKVVTLKDEDQFVKVVTDYIQMMQARQAGTP